MPTKPATKQPASTPAGPADFVSEAVARQEQLDRLFFEYAKSETPSSDVLVALSNCGLTWPEVEHEISRARGVLRFQAQAGTEAERKAATAAAEAAGKALATKRATIDEEIRRLQAELQAVEADASAKHRKTAEQAQAVEGLRKLAPKYVIDAVNKRRGMLKASFAGMIAPLQEAVDTYEAGKLARIEEHPLSAEFTSALSFARAHRPSIVHRHQSGQPGGATSSRYSIDPAGWSALMKDLKAAADKAAPKLAEMIAKRDAAIEEDRALLEIYVPK